MFAKVFSNLLLEQKAMLANQRSYGLSAVSSDFNIVKNRKTSHEGWFFLKKSDFEGKTKVLTFIKILKQSCLFVKIKSQKIQQILTSWLF